MWVTFDWEGYEIEVEYSGNPHRDVQIEKVLIDGMESDIEIPNLEAIISETVVGI